MRNDIIGWAKSKGWQIAVSKKGFTRQGYKYRLTKNERSPVGLKPIMYANNLDDIAYLTGLTNRYPKQQK